MAAKRKIIQQLILDCLHLVVGETTREIPCPFEANPEKGTFSVTRIAEGLLFQCFRDSCKEHGLIPTNDSLNATKGFDSSGEEPGPSKRKPKKFEYDTEPLDDEQLKILSKKYHLNKSTIEFEQWVWCKAQARLIMPIFDQKGKRLGVVARYLEDLADNILPIDIQSKAINYWEVEEGLHLHFPLTDYPAEKTKYCLVEDIPSAVSIQAMGLPAIALLGTNIPKDCLGWFYDKEVIFCLDPDAIQTALHYQKQYNLLFKSCQVFHVPKDPKDMTPKEIHHHITSKGK